VVYETLLEKKKRELHLDIGRAMEEVYKDNLEELVGSLAEHFKEGEDYKKAGQYFHLSARKARRASDYLEAIALAKHQVSCLEKLPLSLDLQKQIIDARVNLATLCDMLNHYIEAKDAVAPIIDLAHQLDYGKRLPAIYLAMASYLNFIEEKHNEDEARRYLTDAMRLALEEKDPMSLWRSYYYEGHRHGWNCEFPEENPASIVS
jgi:hypothetical protein